MGLFESTGTSGKRILWAMLAVLAGVAIPCMHVSQNRLHAARQKRATADMQMLLGALEYFASDHSQQYPADLHELFTKDALGNPYLVRFRGHVPMDAWGRAFTYEPPTEPHPRPCLVSYGADGKPGGDGDDADLSSDDPQFKI